MRATRAFLACLVSRETKVSRLRECPFRLSQYATYVFVLYMSCDSFPFLPSARSIAPASPVPAVTRIPESKRRRKCKNYCEIQVSLSAPSPTIRRHDCTINHASLRLNSAWLGRSSSTKCLPNAEFLPCSVAPNVSLSASVETRGFLPVPRTFDDEGVVETAGKVAADCSNTAKIEPRRCKRGDGASPEDTAL